MSNRTTKRVAATTGFAVATVSLGLAFAPAALAADLPADLPALVAPSTIVAGEKFTISGVECTTKDVGYEPVVAITTTSTSQVAEEVLFAGQPDAEGAWSAEIFFPAADRGDHMIEAVCLTSYNGVDQDLFYPIVDITVTAPATDTPVATPPPAAPKGDIRGTASNTPGVAAQTTGATTQGAVVGKEIVKVYKGFKPLEKVTLTMHSTPTTIGTFTADADGVVTARFTLPAGTAEGTHTLVYEGDQGTYFQETLQVSAASSTGSLAYTGASVGLPLALGAGLLVAGGGALVISRRRSGASQA